MRGFFLGEHLLHIAAVNHSASQEQEQNRVVSQTLRSDLDAANSCKILEASIVQRFRAD
jgi:hypothetical protein